MRGISEKPILVIDLVLNWMSSSQEPLRVMRFRSDQFNPRLVVPGAPNALEAMRALLDAILAATDATALPDASAARGRPFAEFSDLSAYQRAALLIEGASQI